MGKYEISKLELQDAYYITNFYFEDNRGGFTKFFEKEEFERCGIEFLLSESFASVSAKNVIRGLHFQMHNPQAKLVSVLKGRAWDVIVDLRMDSPTYKKWIGLELSEEKHNALYIPRGFAHGFLSLETDTMMLYQCDGEYDAETDTGIRFDEPRIGIDWPIDVSDAIISPKDLKLMSLQEYEKDGLR